MLIYECCYPLVFHYSEDLSISSFVSIYIKKDTPILKQIKLIQTVWIIYYTLLILRILFFHNYTISLSIQIYSYELCVVYMYSIPYFISYDCTLYSASPSSHPLTKLTVVISLLVISYVIRKQDKLHNCFFFKLCEIEGKL